MNNIKHFTESLKELPKQRQSPPGLQKKMVPVPDCGEESYHACNQLCGKKMLVTGGDSGIGRAVAIAYAKEGAKVVVNYLPSEEEDALEMKASLKELKDNVILIPGDLREESFCKKLVKEAYNQLQGLDNITLVAGYQQYQYRIEDISTEQLDNTFKINVYSMFWIIREALTYLSESGSIITTTSIQADKPSSHLLDYATTKGAIKTFTRGLALQLANKNIRVNSVAPGPIWTVLQVAGGQPQDNLPTFGQNTPLERPGEPYEVAGVYVFLASDKASYITGEIVKVTGGEW
ncbi:SDR family oxidoreductase [Vagococcus lutrae]|uniref:SDR family oxidoreductase n=1 Tax=Vagococcus lutrae TaxID=81947 RepID=UPI001444327C|nr:SDR family oxidoreductase [Vagococcus lutrae]NKZ27777.1 SDR family oxidoreductase [Vagococcus lutrae]